MAAPSVCRVYLLDILYHIDKEYDYFIPPVLREQVQVGGFVAVPFGRTTRRYIALITALLPDSNIDRELKPVLSVIHPHLVLNEEQMRLCHFLKEHTFCTIGDAVRAMLPAAALSELLIRYESVEVNPSLLERQSTRRLLIYDYVTKLSGVSESRLVQHFTETVRDDLREMLEDGLLREVPVGRGGSERQELYYRVALSEEECRARMESGRIRGSKQLQALSLLLEEGELTARALKEKGITGATLSSLQEKGLIEARSEPLWRDPFADPPPAPPAPSALTEEQAEAVATLEGLLASGQPKAALLHGVTGSGKTRVMKEVIDRVLASGKQVILLVPEIALTPQTVGYFRAYYGHRTAVLHSMLSAGERYDAWERMRRGEVDLCIGTRSAIFAPLPRLGAIVIDEEQEHTYKSDASPKYHAVDIARFRAAYHSALMLLASATPSFESYTKAKQGSYTLISMKSRYGGARLPSVRLSDMRTEAEAGRLCPIGSELRTEIEAVLRRGEQAILFVNRRGYHNFLSCTLCGEAIRCPSCSVSLTYHAPMDYKTKPHLRCHYCGHVEPIPTHCPACGKEALRRVGYGTQKAEEELRALFPSARIMRMDADTTASKAAHAQILGSFRAGQADILLGTQMVTKGHDFPRVTLVGVLNADSALYLSDFRAAERTFSLLTQVIGRAGRAEREGLALIQTSSPHHALFPLVEAQDYESFYEQEIALRRALCFPPYCDICTLTVSGRKAHEVATILSLIAEECARMCAEEYSDLPIQTFGPMEAPVYRVNQVYRMRLVIKCRLNARTRQFLNALLTDSSSRFGRQANITLDTNPESI